MFIQFLRMANFWYLPTSFSRFSLYSLPLDDDDNRKQQYNKNLPFYWPRQTKRTRPIIHGHQKCCASQQLSSNQVTITPNIKCAKKTKSHIRVHPHTLLSIRKRFSILKYLPRICLSSSFIRRIILPVGSIVVA